MAITINSVKDEKELIEIYSLRYKVYCHEWGYEKPENHKDGLVSDENDINALHFAAKDDSNRTVGAVSLIIDASEALPIEQHCELEINHDDIPREGLSEISRLVIHRNYRRRAEDKYIYGPDEERRSIGSFDFQYSYPASRNYYRRADDKYTLKNTSRRTQDSPQDRRKRHEVILGLYKSIYQESKKRGLTHWYAVMTKGIATLLGKFGIDFRPIGDPVDYHGIRTPFIGEIAHIEKCMSETNTDLYREFNQGI
ncbi:MAG: GNAT family N-acetyltransferase [Nitrospiraceae bacterium]|nr:MAG: GNAT family N-acetyltransferase [Nitrospiraceae bacterium]